MLSLRRLSAVLVLLLPLALTAQMPNIPQFSADMSMSGQGGHEMQGKMYFGGSKIRMDMNAQGHDTEMIHNMTTKTTYMVMPQQKMYMEFTANSAGMMQRGPDWNSMRNYDPNNPCATDPDRTCKKVGTEEVNGRMCDKWLFTSKKNPEETQTTWIDQKLHFPIRNVTASTTWNLTNLKEGSQEASLFEVPSGFRKMDMGGMMGGRPPQ